MLVISILQWARWFQHFRQQGITPRSFKLIIGMMLNASVL
jgi:hypothetical protein